VSNRRQNSFNHGQVETVLFYETRFQEKTMIEKVNLQQKLTLFSDHWSPKIVGELNGQHIKLVKAQGEFTWHHHDDEDELFLVLKGTLTIKLPDHDILLNEGEFVIIPKGVEHKPVAEEEAHILLLEPTSTLNTGNVENELTAKSLERI
jgi:mannose-6-phosphate isomerase-like protein (cupin superfamily)